MRVEPSGARSRSSLHDSFLALYNAEAVTVLAYLTAATGSRADAEDLAAETFCRAWKAWERFRDHGTPPRHWLLKIARNLVVDRSREAMRLVALDDDFAPTGDVTARTAVARAELLRAMGTTSVRDREVLALRSAGLSFAEVGQATDRSPEAAKMAWHRAVRRLRAKFGDER